MFLIRVAFWLGLIIVILPNGNSGNGNVLGIASVAISDFLKFCDRNREACNASKATLRSFGKKVSQKTHDFAEFVEKNKSPQPKNPISQLSLSGLKEDLSSFAQRGPSLKDFNLFEKSQQAASRIKPALHKIPVEKTRQAVTDISFSEKAAPRIGSFSSNTLNEDDLKAAWSAVEVGGGV